MVAVDEARLAIGDILDGCDPKRVATLDHQAHFPRHETDHAVLARIEPFLAGPNALRAQFAARQMHAGEIAGALRQRHQRILIADIAQIDADAGFTVQQFAQFRHRKTVAGVNADDGRALMQERLDFGDELLREIFKLRTEPCLHALAGPDQFFAEGGERRTLAALGLDQRHAEEIGPPLDQIPDVPIGELGVLRSAGELPGFSNFIENAEHHHRRLRAAFLVKSPDGFDLYVIHCRSLYEVDCISLEGIGTSYHIYKRSSPPNFRHNDRRKYDVDCI